MKTLYEQRAAIFKALCDPKRQQIIELLQNGERYVGELAEALKMPQSSLSYHMKILCDSGLVKGREDGKWTYYSINGDGLSRAAFGTIPQINLKEISGMNNFEKNIRRLVLAGIGATANSLEQVNDFLTGKNCEIIDKFAEKGERIVNAGRETNEELHRQVEKDIEDFCEKAQQSESKIDLSAMSAEERAELLRQLQSFEEKPAESTDSNEEN